FTIASTHAGTTLLQGNGGADTVNVQTIAGTTTIQTGADNDTINVGSLAATLNDIRALLVVNGGTGTDDLNLVDTGDSTANVGALTSSHVSGLGLFSTVDYTAFESLEIGL